jgi:superfamily I DNA/RNA helicase
MKTKHPKQLKQAILAELPSGQQENAIFAPEKEFFLRASPGSGKTWTSCRRFLWLVENAEYQSGGVALLSFTNSAIQEFQKATVAAGRREALSDPNFVGTFDSFVERFIMTPFAHLISGVKKRPRLHLSPRPGDRNNPKLKAWVIDKSGTKRPIFAWDITPMDESGELALRGSLGDGEFSIDPSSRLPVMQAFLDAGFYTHNQRNFWACLLLEGTPRLAEIIARRFPEIIVDEAQDTGVWQIQLLRQLRSAGAKITLVGDPDQCIYEFSLASVSSLRELKDEWKLLEKPLEKSFRCNNAIANAVRSISGNAAFHGCGEPRNGHKKAYVFGDSSVGFEQAVALFRKKLNDAGILEKNCAILCRGHEQIAKVRGSARYLDLQGKTREMAEASFLRDKNSDFKTAFERTEKVLRGLADAPDVWSILDEMPESKEALQIRVDIWQFVRSQNGLPPISLNASNWVNKLKDGITRLLNRIGVKNPPQLGQQFRKTGINDEQKELPLFEEQALFPIIRIETIHKVKGESIDGVLVIGSKRFFDGVVKNVTAKNDTEDCRLAYVAMTRAKYLLVVAPPKSHVDAHKSFWKDRGFELSS